MSDSILVVAGEASADLHAAKVISALRQQSPGLHFFGVGGAHLEEAGMKAMVRAQDISIGGLTEVLFAIPRILGFMRKLVKKAEQLRPCAALLLDLPDFNLRLAKKIKKLGIPVVYYISPQVWAWRPGRVKQIRRVVDKMLVILPFEKEFYEKHGVPVEFVGHPLIEELPAPGSTDNARAQLGITGQGQLVALLPGSRDQEVKRHLPLMLNAVKLLQAAVPDLRAVVPIANTIARELVQNIVRRQGVSSLLIDGQASEVLSAADAAVVCSGTATLQTALLQRPMVVVYRLSWLSFQILKRLVKVAHIALVNLIAGKSVVKELIQNDFTAENVAAELRELLQNAETKARQNDEFRRLRKTLGGGGAAQRVAEVLLTYVPNSGQVRGFVGPKK